MTELDQQQPQAVATEIEAETITLNLNGMRQWVALHGYQTESAEYDTKWLMAHVEGLLATVGRQAEQIERLQRENAELKLRPCSQRCDDHCVAADAALEPGR